MTVMKLVGRLAVFLAAANALDSTTYGKSGVVLMHSACYQSGGNAGGGGHPTAGVLTFTVPDCPNRVLLVLGQRDYDPKIPKETRSQRESLVSFTYAGVPLKRLHGKEDSPSNHGYGSTVFWYMVDPPAGTHEFRMTQHRVDNGGETRLAALVFAGVDTDKPFTDMPTAVSRKGAAFKYGIKGKAGGLVVNSLYYGRRNHKYHKIMPGKKQTLVWEHCHEYRYEWIGTVAPAAESAEMEWRQAMGSGECHVQSVAINPARDGKPAIAPRSFKALPKDSLGSEKPGIVARVYDLAENPPKPSTTRQNYKRPALGAMVPRFDRQSPHTTRIIDAIDFHPLAFVNKPDRLPDGKGILNSGIRKNFVIEFTGRLNVPESGTVMFDLLCVDQAKLYIDGRLVIDNRGHNYNTAKTTAIQMERGKHDFRLVNVEDTARFGIALGWRLPGGYPHGIPRKSPVVLIPPSAFTHQKRPQ